ncbi:MAG: hypothetical protein U9Q83_11670 [Bacteroidota bacterium]|nr:hypothetical protein [Bacteroidota bacterium]
MENKFVNQDYLLKNTKTIKTDVLDSSKRTNLSDKNKRIINLRRKINKSEQRLKELEAKIEIIQTRIIE